jgi:hypothetical protein
MKSGSANLSWRGGGEGSNKFECKFYKYEQPIAINVLESNVTICLYGVLATMLQQHLKNISSCPRPL